MVVVLGVLGVLVRREDQEGRGYLVALEVLVVLVGWTTRKRRWGMLAWAQEEALDQTAGRLLRTLLGEGTMHLQKGE